VYSGARACVVICSNYARGSPLSDDKGGPIETRKGSALQQSGGEKEAEQQRQSAGCNL